MNTTVVLSLDSRKPKKDLTCPIILRVTHNRLTATVRTGVYVQPKDWDSKERKVKASYRGTESVARLNNRLQKKKSEATDYIFKLDEQKKLNALTVTELKNLIERKPEHHSLFSFAELLIAEMKELGRIGNATTYATTLKALRKFMDGKDLPFIQVTPEWLRRFEHAFMKKPGNTFNGLAVYMRTTRAIYNKAIKAKLVDRELYPFAEYSIKHERTRKRAIPIEYIIRIEELEIKPGSRLFNARNYFLTSFYLRGINFTDMALLKLKNIVDGRIFYKRAKTGMPFDIKIPVEMQAILNLYTPGKGPEDYIFPIVKRDTPEGIYDNILWARKRFNKRLKEIARLAKIDAHLTSYVPRHSFATRAKNLGFPIANISQAMGHTDIRTTQIYLDSLPSDELDEMHEKVIKR